MDSGLKILDRVFDNESKESKEENKQNTEIESKGLSQEMEVKPKEQTQASPSDSTILHNRLDYVESTTEKTERRKTKTMQLKKPDNEQAKTREDRIVLDLRSDDVRN